MLTEEQTYSMESSIDLPTAGTSPPGRGSYIQTAQRILAMVSEKTVQAGLGPVVPYDIKGEHPEELKFELDCESVPFCGVQGRPSMIFVNAGNYPLVRSLNERMLRSRGSYVQELQKNDLETAVASSEAVKNKELIEINGLSEDERSRFIKNCGKISQSLIIGSDDNSFGAKVVFSAEMLDQEKSEKIAKALLQSLISVHGSKSAGKELRQIDYYKKVMERTLVDSIDKELQGRIADENSMVPKDYLSRYKAMASQMLINLENENVPGGIKKAIERMKILRISPETYVEAGDRMKTIGLKGTQAIVRQTQRHAEERSSYVPINERGGV